MRIGERRRSGGGGRTWRIAWWRGLGAVLLLALLAGGCSIPRWPVEGTISSPYGLRRHGGFLPRMHHGVDIPLPVGTPVRAMAAGTVIFSGTMSGYGTLVVIDHGSQIHTYYAHLSETRVERGQEVRGRQVIALSGRSGNVTGPHLHFEVRRRGWPIDPVPMLGREPRPNR